MTGRFRIPARRRTSDPETVPSRYGILIPMRPTLRCTLGRILRTRCPRCGTGAIFERSIVRAERCDHCHWEYERGQGFWIGGSEVHMFASYGISVLLFIPPLILLGSTTAVQIGVIAGHVVCSLLLLRYSRSVFIGLDYYFDPGEGGGDDDRDGDGVPVEPHPRRPLRRQKRRAPPDLRRPARGPARPEPAPSAPSDR
jgi:uncharacterized protein (DUF983 family)